MNAPIIDIAESHRHRIGCSQIAQALGVSPFGSRYDLRRRSRQNRCRRMHRRMTLASANRGRMMSKRSVDRRRARQDKQRGRDAFAPRKNEKAAPGRIRYGLKEHQPSAYSQPSRAPCRANSRFSLD